MENSAQSASPPQPPPHAPQPLHFNGNGAEYFGIWIVNLLLTIVTLGIYSAWAKVRRLQYFYRHTELAGSSFDFHGSPIRILIGRLIALAMLIAYNVSVRLQSRMIFVIVVGAGDSHAVAAAQFIPLSALQHQLARHALSFSRQCGRLLSGVPAERVSNPDHALPDGAIHASAAEAVSTRQQLVRTHPVLFSCPSRAVLCDLSAVAGGDGGLLFPDRCCRSRSCLHYRGANAEAGRARRSALAIFRDFC